MIDSRVNIQNWKEAFEYCRDVLGPGTHEVDVTFDSIAQFKDAAWRYMKAAGEWHIKALQMSSEFGMPLNRMKIIIADHEWQPLYGRVNEDRSREREKIDALQPGESVFLEGGPMVVQYVRSYVSNLNVAGDIRVRKEEGGCVVERAAPGHTFLSRRGEILKACNAILKGYNCVIEFDADEFGLGYVRTVVYQEKLPISVSREGGVIRLMKREARAAGSTKSKIMEYCKQASGGATIVPVPDGDVPLNYLRVTVSEWNQKQAGALRVEKRGGGYYIMGMERLENALIECANQKIRGGAVQPETRDRLKSAFQEILNYYR